MPLLKYNIDPERKCKGDVSELIITSIKNGQAYELNFSFKNIGLNSIKNIIIDYESDVINSTYRLYYVRLWKTCKATGNKRLF